MFCFFFFKNFKFYLLFMIEEKLSICNIYLQFLVLQFID